MRWIPITHWHLQSPTPTSTLNHSTVPRQNLGLACTNSEAPTVTTFGPAHVVQVLSRALDGLKIEAWIQEPIKMYFKHLLPQNFESAVLHTECTARQCTSLKATQQCCLFHWNRRCVVCFNYIPIFIGKFSSQYLFKTLFLSLLFWKPLFILLDHHLIWAFRLQTNKVFIFKASI